MKYVTFGCLGLIALAACAADGISADTPPPDPGDEPGGSEVPLTDAGPADGDAYPDVERPLVCGKTGFCETKLPLSELGAPPSLRSIWVVASNDVWSVSAEGSILHYDGTSWTTSSQSNHELHSVWATETDVWVGGERGLLLHWTTGGGWTQVETGHLKDIRGIYGTGASDVWFGRDGAVDHFDGSTMTSHALEIPGLQVKALFGRPGFGTYAAYAEGCVECGGDATSRPYLFELTPDGAARFNTALSTKWNFFPLSGVVSDRPEDEGRVFLFGYAKAYFGWTLRFASFGKETAPIELKSLKDMHGSDIYLFDPNFAEYPPPPLLPAWGNEGNDIRVQHAIGMGHRWNGTDFTTQAIDMGYDFVPRKVFAVHGNASDTWIVGDGFALKGPTR